MNNFSYQKPTDADQAIASVASNRSASFLGGGTNLIDHLKLGVETPSLLVDVRHSTPKTISFQEKSCLIGAGVTNSALAYDPHIQSHFPALAKAILSGASPQLRNAATTAGNLLQRTRCYYFRDIHSPCNKRNPGSGCSAIDGLNRIHAILGTSPSCIATHPSDMAVAMTAFEAVVHIQGASGVRQIPIESFYVPYGEDPAKENVLTHGDLIVGVELPVINWFAHSTYIKARDRASYEFALASAAVVLEIKAGLISNCRIALGGVGTKPWRAHSAEATLVGKPATLEVFKEAADKELQSAVPQKYNAFKIELCKRVIVKALTDLNHGEIA